jgi:hypothetical protein
MVPECISANSVHEKARLQNYTGLNLTRTWHQEFHGILLH